MSPKKNSFNSAGGPIPEYYDADIELMISRTKKIFDDIKKMDTDLSEIGSGGKHDTGAYPNNLSDSWHKTMDEAQFKIYDLRGIIRKLLNDFDSIKKSKESEFQPHYGARLPGDLLHNEPITAKKLSDWLQRNK